MRFFLVFVFLVSGDVLYAGRQTPVYLSSMQNQIIAGEAEEWRPPNYRGQSDRLGYVAEDFQIDGPLERQIRFWIDIYSKFDSNQGLLHDAEHIDMVYETVNFPVIQGTTAERKKIKERRREKVKLAKERAEKLLDTLQAHLDRGGTEEELTGKAKEVWQAFRSETGKKKFKEAKKKHRLRLQLGQKDQFQLGIYYSGRYLDKIEAIFAEHGLPRELTRLPLVESSFNILARSKVGASGIWQFMRSSAKPYMKVNRYVDERNDPIKASEAAAKMLKGNYRMLKKWPLAITAYNYGPNGMRRLVRRNKTDDLAKLIETAKHRRFGFASKNFYPSFLAAIHVEQNAGLYFDQPQRAKPFLYKSIVLDRPLNWTQLVDWFGQDPLKTKLYNPYFTSSVTRGLIPIPARQEIHVTPESYEPAKQKIAQLPHAVKVKKYRIRRGDTLSVIARRFGVSIKSLKETNGLKSAHRIRSGQTLYIP